MSQYRAILLRGFSPIYTESTANKIRILFHLQVDSNNYSQLNFDNSTKKFNYVKSIGGVVTTLSSNAQTFLKNQVINFLTEQTNVGMTLRILKNNGTVEKYTNAIATTFTGNAQLYPLTKNVTGNEADAFLDTLQMFDLTKNPSGYTDAVANDMLNGNSGGNASGFENPELFNINSVALHANATRSNGVITLNASATYQQSTIYIPVLPSNKYRIEWNVTGYIDGTTRPSIKIFDNYNNVQLRDNISSAYTSNNGKFSYEMVTTDKTNKIRIEIANYGTGIFTFSQMSVKRKD